MKVSVLITFYNQEKYVDEAMQSVMSQKCNFPFEVIIGDDGSTDGTIQKVKEWEKKYPNQIKHIVMGRDTNKKYNGSQRASHNRLALLERVSGEYFLFLDGDDFFVDENKLQRQVDVLDNPQNKDCSMCGHNVFEYDEVKGTNRPFITLKDERKYTGEQYWGGLYFHPDSIMMRSKYISQIDRSIVNDYFNDNTITYCFLKFGSIYYLPEIMASYRQTGDGIWTGSSKLVGLLRNLMDLDLELKINPNLKRQCFARHRADIHYFLTNKEPISSNISFYENKITRDHLEIAREWLDYKRGKQKISFSLCKMYMYANWSYFWYHVKRILLRK